MPSPFPGMDPFLENHWGDVHTSLTTYTRNSLRPQLPADLRVRVEEYQSLELYSPPDDEKSPHRIKPDVRIVETPGGVGTALRPGLKKQVLPAAAVRVSLEPRTQRRVLIVDRKRERLVTSIEFLSITNKYGKDRRRFLRKQNDLWDGGASIVEIDLLRRGKWSISCGEVNTPPECRYPYRIFAHPAWTREADFYSTSIHEPLPAISIPLREGEEAAVLELQMLIEQAWEDGGYSDIDYSADLLAEFSPEDTQWIRERLASHGAPRKF